VKDWQSSADAALKNLKEKVWTGVEAYEDAKFGDPVPYLLAATPGLGTAAVTDRLTGGRLPR
jgi:hypothetical protein